MCIELTREELEKIAMCLKNIGYRKLTDIQIKSVRKVLKDKKHTLIIVAPTGSGKTEAAVFPVMLKITKCKENPIAAIYVTPLRALNRDIERRLKIIAECYGLEVAVRHGDTSRSIRKNIEKSPPHILITTPETFNYIIINPRLRRYLVNLEYIIIDEFRDLLESKRGLLLLTTIYLLEKYLGKRFVKIALTATLRDVERAVDILSYHDTEASDRIIDSSMRQYDIKVYIPRCSTPLCREIKSIVEDEDISSRLEEILEIIKESRYVIVFTNTRSLAESLGSLLRDIVSKLGLDIKIEVHHGSLSRRLREKVEKSFREREVNAIVSTSSLELGIDIGHVDQVVQYISPRQVVRLMQRVGRSRHRLGEIGKGVVVSARNLFHVLESLVIASRCLNNQIEEEQIMVKPLDVLAYAITLYVYINHLDNVKISIDKLYEIVKNNPLYTDLTLDEYRDVVDYLVNTRILKLTEENHLVPTKRTKMYLYETLMIPSNREIKVVEKNSEKDIGSLDEEYVISNLNPGDVIILSCRPWRIINYDEDKGKLYVETVDLSTEESITIPYWEGESIPVDYAISQEVGRVIRYLKEKKELPEYLKKLLYSNESFRYLDLIANLGDDSTIYIDYVKDYDMIILNIYGGSRVNTLIKDILGYILRDNYPYLKLRLYSAPYAIFIFTPGIRGVEKDLLDFLCRVIKDLHVYSNDEKLRQIAKSSPLFTWRIYQVAQRFGAISRGTRISKSIVEAFSDSLVGREALNEVLYRDYDKTSFTRLTSDLWNGRISVKCRVLGELGDHHSELIKYIEIPRVKDIKTFDFFYFWERLLRRRIHLICIGCRYHREDTVKEILKLDEYSCPRCRRATLTIVKGDASEELKIIEKLVKNIKLNREEQKIRDDLAERAVLLYRYKKLALLAFSTLGVGTREAVTLINKALQEADIYLELYEVEKKFLERKRIIT